MTHDDKLREWALERLRGDDELLLYVAGDYRDLAQPLAALIEAAASSTECNICHGDLMNRMVLPHEELPDVRHEPDCELMALVRAINGEKP